MGPIPGQPGSKGDGAPRGKLRQVDVLLQLAGHGIVECLDPLLHGLA